MKKLVVLIVFLFFVSFDYLRAETEHYNCIEVTTDVVNDSVQYGINKENQAQFTLKDCELKDIKIHTKAADISYDSSRRLVENGNVEKNDLFAYMCEMPFIEGNDITGYKKIEANFYRAKISPLISPKYPLYPTLKQTAQKLNLDLPDRTFVIFSKIGYSTHEFFCYAKNNGKKPLQDKCTYSFEHVLDIHLKNRDALSLSAIAEKYTSKLEYDKSEKAYLMAMKIDSDYEPLFLFYKETGQYKKAITLLSKALSNDPYNYKLYTDLAIIYLYDNNYNNAESYIRKALRFNFENERNAYEVYEVLGDILMKKRDYGNVIASFEMASNLAKKQCESDSLMLENFLNNKVPPTDCESEVLPYQLKIIYSLIELDDFNNAEKLANSLLSKFPSYSSCLYIALSNIYAGKNEFDKAIEMADKSVSLFQIKGIGAKIEMGEVYPQIISVDIGSPAYKAGLKVSDRIINVGDKDLRLFIGQDKIQMITDYLNNASNPVLKVCPKDSEILKNVPLKPEEYLRPTAAWALALKALVLRESGKKDEFEKNAIRAYELNPDIWLTQITMALAFADKGNNNKALNILEKAKAHSNDSIVLLIKPIVCKKSKKLDEAINSYKEIPKELLQTKNAFYRKFLDEVNL